MKDFSSIDMGAIRENYVLHQLTEESTGSDPILFFQQWFSEAVHSKVMEVNAMVLSTIDAQGFPEGRVVLLKDLEEGKFVFYTNYESQKGRQMAALPQVSLVFFWPELQRQVRIVGAVTRISRVQSETYFQSRPWASQIAAVASAQSSVLPSREVLERAVKELEEKYVNSDVPCPENWGGYAVTPQAIEFWQGGENRLHDRIKFFKKDNSWAKQRLSP